MKIGDLVKWESSVVGVKKHSRLGLLLEIISLDPRSKFTQSCGVVLFKDGKMETVLTRDLEVINESG